MVTGIPALAKLIAMPPPIVPPPITPTLSTGRWGVSLAKPSIFDACRSAKKMCLIPADWELSIHSANSLRSIAWPSANDNVVAASTAETICPGAICPLARFARTARYSSKIDGSKSGTTCSLLRRTGALSPISSSAQARAPPSKSPSTILSTRPMSTACPAEIGAPLVMRSSDALTPARRVVRCVPPAPGSKPSFTSGMPTFADEIAHR